MNKLPPASATPPLQSIQPRQHRTRSALPISTPPTLPASTIRPTLIQAPRTQSTPSLPNVRKPPPCLVLPPLYVLIGVCRFRSAISIGSTSRSGGKKKTSSSHPWQFFLIPNIMGYLSSVRILPAALSELLHFSYFLPSHISAQLYFSVSRPPTFIFPRTTARTVITAAEVHQTATFLHSKALPSRVDSTRPSHPRFPHKPPMPELVLSTSTDDLYPPSRNLVDQTAPVSRSTEMTAQILMYYRSPPHLVHCQSTHGLSIL